MAKIKPFQALVFNQAKIEDLSKAVCPPYDVVSPTQQQALFDKSPYNLIHILLRKDSPGEDKYKQAGEIFKDWLQAKILIKDDRPAIYFYSQQYKIRGETKTRYGFISLIHLGFDKPSAHAHENTRLPAKEDRFKLIQQVSANLSPIFAVFQDKKRVIQRTFEQIARIKPDMEAIDDEKTIHKIWKVTAPELLKLVQSGMEQEEIFIADGHHRYEVGAAYRDLMKEKLGKSTGEEDFNYIMSYFTNTDPRGLSILPIHRLIKLSSVFDTKKFLEAADEHFDVEEVKDKAKFFFLMEKGGVAEHLLGMYKDKKYWLLRLKNIKILDKLISDKPKEYRSLDVSILNYMVLKNILGLDLTDKESFVYSPHIQDIIKEVDEHPGYIGFFLNPVKMEQIISVALAGEKMPPKSTYFYPKVLSGLTINKFEDR